MTATHGIVIPTLNEAALLPRCLDALRTCGAVVLVADGGSTEGTIAIAATHALRPRVMVVHGGRHFQLSQALASMTCEWVLVLPADAQLRPGADQRIAVRCRHLVTATACLDLVPDDRAWQHRWRRVWSRMRSRWTGGAYLDQAPLFRRLDAMRAGAFRACGAYDSADLGRRLRHRGRLRVLSEPVMVLCRDCRRNGFWSVLLKHQRLRVRWWLSSPPRG